MSKLEKFLSKASQPIERKGVDVEIDGDVWNVRPLSLSEMRACEKLADKEEKFNWYLYNDARIVKATEHDFPWNNKDLLHAYGVHTKYELPAKMFEHNIDGYTKLLNAIRGGNGEQVETETEEAAVEEAKN